jgi:hypothetical protein
MQHRGRAALSAPRPAPKCNRASAPVDVVHRRDHEPSALHVSRPLRDVCFHDSIPLGVWQRHDREGHDFSPALSPRRKKQPHPAPWKSGDTAPRPAPKCNRASAPVDVVRRRDHEPSVPHVSRPLRDMGFHDSIPLGIRQRHDTRRARLQPCRKPPRTHTAPWKSSASAPRPGPRIELGFSPRGHFR